MVTPEHIERILAFPPETWTAGESVQVREHRAHVHREMFSLADTAEREARNLTAEEADWFGALQAEYDRLSDVALTQR